MGNFCSVRMAAKSSMNLTMISTMARLQCLGVSSRAVIDMSYYSSGLELSLLRLGQLS